MNLDQFARKMWELLLANRHKDQVQDVRHTDVETYSDGGPGWRRETPEAVMQLVEQAVRDLRDAFIEGKGFRSSSSIPRASSSEHPADEHVAFVVEKAGDLAVLAYMIADIVTGDRGNAYLREHLTLAEQVAAMAVAELPELWVCERCNRAEAFDESGPWHACRACGGRNFRRTDGTSERREVPGRVGEAKPGGGCAHSGG